MEQNTTVTEDRATEVYKKVYASNMPKTRSAMNKLLNHFLQNEDADTQRFRATIYALKAIADTHKSDIEDRVAALEDALRERGSLSVVRGDHHAR